MYQFNNLSLTDIKNIVIQNQEYLFSKIMNEEIIISYKKYISPFRIDENPGCYFEYYEDRLFFIDWADYPIKRDIISFYKDIITDKLSFESLIYQLYHMIDKNIKISKKDIKLNVLKRKKKKEVIIPYQRYYNELDVKYWGQFGIDLQDLKDKDHRNFKIIALKKYKLVKSNNVVLINDLAYGYIFKSGVKIYSPFNKKRKWRTTTTKNDIGLNIFNNNQKVFLTKSVKDSLCLEKAGYNSIFLQSENSMPDIKILISILKNKEVIILFDNDKAGYKFSKIIYELLNMYKNYLYSLKIYFLPENDTALFIKNHNIIELQKLLDNV